MANVEQKFDSVNANVSTFLFLTLNLLCVMVGKKMNGCHGMNRITLSRPPSVRVAACAHARRKQEKIKHAECCVVKCTCGHVERELRHSVPRVGVELLPKPTSLYQIMFTYAHR